MPKRFRAGAIIVAAGSGSRMGRPKQFLPLCGRPVCEWSLEAFRKLPEVSDIALVLDGESVRRHGGRLGAGRVKVVEGGATRMDSVVNGFGALSPAVDVVAVHDGARPLVSAGIIRKTLTEALRSGAAVAAVPAKDTLKQVRGKALWVCATPDRSEFWQAQTPQSYRREILAAALKRSRGKSSATDESQLVERAGQRVRIVPSGYENIKITTPEDLVFASAMMNERRGGAVRETRTGLGYDIHRLVKGRPLFLAGMKVPHAKGLLGHSDGDVVLHAACDAVLGALGEGEIGIAFPPSDPKFKGISSHSIAEHVLGKLEDRGAEIANLDVAVVAEEPKLKGRYRALVRSLAEVFRIDRSRVNVKAKSNEGLGPIGRGEAIACHAVATLRLPAD
ncbi:MAG: 2-C-methyl-D-erythritol 4-phosphate cytidylyltransferase [Elusimicrobiota bacterium]